ncbi:MAG: UxaA family hydrolase, partial [Smithellaceae bacterium]|nr:UxaA family hydrolase [Smithellaceae bacterium]
FMTKALIINPRDNVAVVLAEVKAGTAVEVTTAEGTIVIAAREDIRFGHKIALRELAADEPVIKYGEEIGQARTIINIGDWVHLHNLDCRRGH